MATQPPKRQFFDIMPPKPRPVKRAPAPATVAAVEPRDEIAPEPALEPVQTLINAQVELPPIPPAPKPPKPRQDPRHVTIAEHIQELRTRMMWSIAALFVGGAIGYMYHDQIINILVRPLGQQLYYTSPTGGFDFLIKTCLFFGFILAIPILVYNLLRFIAPAVPGHVTYKTGKVLIISSILALMGIAFAYFISLPAALHFLNNFSTGAVTSLISANEYFAFVMIYMAGFALLFQMPLILYFVNKITPLTPKLLMQKQKVVILASFIIAAILTPTPDPVNQAIMAVPMIALYQSSIGVVWQSNRRTRKKLAKQSHSHGLQPAAA